MRNGIFFTLLLLLPLLTFKVQAAEVNEISVLSVNSAITPATFDYLKQHIKSLPKTSFIILRLNTPGGLVTTTKDIITLVGQEKRPLAVWIYPEGASAASAGAIIASAAHYIFMSPGTNMGAATPVGLGEDIKEGDGRSKAMNDLKALVRSLSHSRGRPAEPFEKMIDKAESYTDKESLKLGIIDGIVSNIDEIPSLISKKTIEIDGVKTEITFSDNLHYKEIEPTIGQKILEVLANPSTAYFLFLIAVALIYFEFQAPGGYIAGSIGAGFLILAGISFQVLPLDWGSMGLIALGLFLLVLEVFITSYGVLAIAGLASFIMGSLFLFHGESGYISVQYPVLLSTFLGVAFSLGVVLWFLWKENKKKISTASFFLPLGAKGSVLTKNAQNYQIKVQGEIWNGTSDEELSINDQVEVITVDENKLFIKVKKYQ